MYKDRKETTHGEIGEDTYIHIYIYIYIYIKKISIMYVNKWLQDQYTLGKGKKRKENIRTSLHPSKFINTPFKKNFLY